MRETLDAILLVYHHPLIANAITIMEHVESFSRHSRFPVVKVNTEYGFPAELKNCRFRALALHYSLFGADVHFLDAPWYDLIQEHQQAYKVAFKQDEFHGCKLFFQFLDQFHIDCLFTLYDPQHWDQLHRKYCQVPQLVYNLPGYLSSDMTRLAQRYSKPFEKRSVDFGHRARRLPYYMGRGSQEKWLIAREFIERTRGMGLKLDISWAEKDRIYGQRWYQWLGNCRGTLGAEGGTSITDWDGSIQRACDAYLQEHPQATFEEISRDLLYQYEDNIPYRTMSPQRFDAAAMRTCQILYEGEYNGVFKPWDHYLPLKRDWSNLDELLRLYRDPAERTRLVDTAYRDLVESGQYGYDQFIIKFDQHLMDAGCSFASPTVALQQKIRRIQEEQQQRQRSLWAKACLLKVLVSSYLPLRFFVTKLPKPWRRKLRRVLGLQRPGDT